MGVGIIFFIGVMSMFLSSALANFWAWAQSDGAASRVALREHASKVVRIIRFQPSPLEDIMGVDMSTLSSNVRFRAVTNEESTTRMLVAEILDAGYYDDGSIYRHGDPSAANSYKSLFAGFRQLLLPAQEKNTFVSLGNDDRHYAVDYLWQKLAPHLEDGSYYAYLVDFKTLRVLAIHNGMLVVAQVSNTTKDDSTSEESLRASNALVANIIGGTTLVAATPVIPEWFDDTARRGAILSDLAAGDLLPLFNAAN